MKITQIKELPLKRFERENYCIGKYDITFDNELRVHNVLLKDLGEKIVVQWPTYRTDKGFCNYANPITRLFGDYCKNKLMAYYEENKNEVIDNETD